MRQTFLGESFSGLHDNLWRRGGTLYLEALFCTATGVFVPVSLGLQESILISLFLVSVPMSQRLSTLLEENRIRIWEAGQRSIDVNRITGVCLLCMFFGIFTGYLGAALFNMRGGQLQDFDFALTAANVGRDTILTRRFGEFFPILGHNALVLCSFVLLSFLYRAFGAILALSWNACVWATVIVVLVQRALELSPLSPWTFGLTATAALLPHLGIEGVAYIFGSLSAIFFSQGVTRYALRDPRFLRVLKASVAIMLLALLILGLGAATEATYAPFMLRHLQHGP